MKANNSFRYGSKYACEPKTYYYNTDVCKDSNDYRSSRPEVFLEISQKSQENTCARVCLFLDKVAGLRPATFFSKMTLVQVSSCEFCEISKNTFFHRTPLVAVSIVSSKWTA